MRILGARIRQVRLRRELCQSLVAERASVSVQTAGRIENGAAGVRAGAYGMVLQALCLLELLEGWGNIADRIGEALADKQLRQRAPKVAS